MDNSTDWNLTPAEKQLIAFALFSVSMRIGPTVFKSVERVSIKLGTADRYVHYANDWVHYNQTIQQAKEQGIEKWPDFKEPDNG